MPSLSQQVKKRLEEATTAADDLSVPVSIVVNKAIRVARLRNDWSALVWLLMETRGTEDEDAKNRAGIELAPHLSTEEMSSLWAAAVKAFMSERKLSTKAGMLGVSVAEAEALAAAFREQASHLQPAPGLQGQDLQATAHSLAEQRAQLLNAAADTGNVLARVRSRVANYLAQVEQQIVFGQVNADVWERNRAYVDMELARVAPDALVQFQAAYRRHAENDPEARSQALLSCRRVLKSVADVLCPATNEPIIGVDGKPHPLSDDKFINRLIRFISDVLRDKAGEVLTAELADFGARLDALNELAIKGVHAQVSEAEVDLCLIRTYLFVGDLLRIRRRTSAALEPNGYAT